MKKRYSIHLVTLSALVLAFAAGMWAQAAQTSTAAQPVMGSRIFDWEKLAVAPTKNGERRAICDGPTATIERFESHVTTLNAGQSAHPPHRHPTEELIVVKEGTLEVNLNGQRQRVGPGSVLFYAPNDPHTVRNVGATPATYHVFSFRTPATPKPVAR